MSSFLKVFGDVRPPKPTFLPEDYPDLDGKTALVTGTSAGIGREVLTLLVQKRAKVIVFNRSKARTEEAIKVVKQAITESNPELIDTFDERVKPVYGDLGDLTTIKPAFEEIKTITDKIDLAILNAGVMLPPNGSITTQGYELQFGINVLGHQLLTHLITPLILKAKTETNTPRIVFVTSSGHWRAPENGGIDYKRGFKDASAAASDRTYAQSKTGNIYQASIFGQDHPEIISLSAHPGMLYTDLGRSLPKFVLRIWKLVSFPPIYGAYTELWAALNPEITTKDNGRYVGPWGNFRDLRPDISEGRTNGAARKLWDFAENEIKEYL